ncbi:unnamed protein product [Rhizophagus irregularis]|nr:unnamed protein product [Rhizophagus irregularis]
MCNIPFSIIENPWFIDLIKTLQPGYDPPSRQVLSGTLLESETSRVNIRIMNELSADNNFTIGGGLKTYVETRWTTVYECVHSVWRLKDALQHVLENHEHEISNQAIKTILKKRGFFDDVRPSMRGAGIHNTQFERIQKTALNIWKNLGHKKTSGLELKAQLRKYLDQDNPYSAPYSNNDGPFQWWNYIIDGRSSLSRLAKIVFSITPHSASCERLFSALGWMFGKRRTNLNVQTIECMSKIYTHNIHSLSNSKRSLNHIGNSISNDDVQKMIDTLFEEGDILNENEDEEEEYEEPPNIQKENIDEILNIEQVIDLGPWVFIESSEIPFMFNNKYDSENDDNWNPEEIV